MSASEKLATKPLDVSELQKCALCDRGMMHGGAIHFYEANIGQCVVNVGNLQRMHGLEQMMQGNVALARVFSPDNTVALRLPTKRVLICADCVFKPVAALLED